MAWVFNIAFVLHGHQYTQSVRARNKKDALNRFYADFGRVFNLKRDMTEVKVSRCKA